MVLRTKGRSSQARRPLIRFVVPAARRRYSRTPRTPPRRVEIATYTALERLANRVGDEPTAKLTKSIRADEETMLASAQDLGGARRAAIRR